VYLLYKSFCAAPGRVCLKKLRAVHDVSVYKSLLLLLCVSVYKRFVMHLDVSAYNSLFLHLCVSVYKSFVIHLDMSAYKSPAHSVPVGVYC
jgi:hypothetical protein